MEINEELLQLTRENNKILRGMRSSQRWDRLFKIVYWLAILGVSIAGYYLVQPMISPLMNNFNSIISSFQGMTNGLPSMNGFQLPAGTLDALKNGLKVQ